MDFADYVSENKPIKVMSRVLRKQVGKKYMKLTNYPVGDFLVRVKNAALAGKRVVVVDKTNLSANVAKTLKRMGYLDEVKVIKGSLEVRLTYQSKKPIINDIKLVSKPGVRIYQDVSELEKYRGLYEFIVSTPKGVLSSKEAIKKNVGGEVIAKLY